jgi:hypothetical protein
MADHDVEVFKTEVREFDEIDAQIKSIREKIKPLNTRIKELTTVKNKLKTEICGFMATNEIDSCNMNSGKLQFKERKAVKPISKGDICDSMSTFFTKHYDEEFKAMTPNDKAKALHTFIYQENREYADTQTLLRKN